MTEQDEGKIRMLRPSHLAQLPDRVDRRTQAAGAEATEALAAAVLAHPGAAVTAMIVGVDDEPGILQRTDHRAIAAGVLAHAVEEMDDAAGSGHGSGEVVDDLDTVHVGVLGHAGSLARRAEADARCLLKRVFS